MRNEADREACGARATRKRETKPIRGGGGHGENAWARCAKRSQSARGRAHAGTTAGEAFTNARGRCAKRSQSHFRTVRQSGSPFDFQYKTGVEGFECMCLNRLGEIAVTEKGLLGSAALETCKRPWGTGLRRVRHRACRLLGTKPRPISSVWGFGMRSFLPRPFMYWWSPPEASD